MADINKLSRLLDGINRNVDMSANTLVLSSIKLGGGQTELTESLLSNLINLQNGSDVSASVHHHDSRYFTETELGDSTASSGSDLVGDDNTYTNFTPAAATIKGAMSGIDTALGSALGTDEKVKVSANDTTGGFLLDKITVSAEANVTDVIEVKEVNDAGDEDLKIAFDESKLSHLDAGSSKHDASEIDYERADGSKKNIQAGSDTTESAVTDLDDAIGSLDATPTNYSAASPSIVASHLAGIDSQIGTLSSTVSNFEWQPSVLDADILDPTALTPSTGDRYLINGTGAGAWSGQDNAIAEWNGSAWAFTAPTTGTFVSADDEANLLYLFGAATWETKAFESTTASTGLAKVGNDIRLDSTSAGSGIGFTSGVLNVNVDNTSIEISTDTLQVKALGIDSAELAADSVTADKVNSDVAGSGLSQAGSGALDVDVDDIMIQVGASGLEIKDASITDAKVAVGTGLKEAIDFFASTDISSSEAETLTDNSNADSLHAHANLDISFVAGGAISAGDVLIASTTVAGEVIAADGSALSTAEGVIGVALESKTSSQAIKVRVMGKATINKSVNFDLGKRVYLSENAGQGTKTAPSTAASVIVFLGIAVSTSEVLLSSKDIVAVN